MPKETTIQGRAGQKYIVLAPTGERVTITQDKARTRGAVTISGTYVPDEPPPPVDPPQTGIVVPAGVGLKAAIEAAAPGSTLILRGGDHVLSTLGTTPAVTVRKRLTLWNYANEFPRIHAASGRPNLIYSESDGDVDFHGIEFGTITTAYFDDGNGSALVEAINGGKMLFDDGCVFAFSPGSVSSRQHMIYASSNGSVTVRRSEFYGGKNGGVGVHCYHDPGATVTVEDSTFDQFGSATTYGLAIVFDQTGLHGVSRRNTFRDITWAAVQHVKSAGSSSTDDTFIRCARSVEIKSPGMTVTNPTVS